MQTPWIGERQLAAALERHEAFWRGELHGGPLMWVAVPNARPGTPPPEPGTEDAIWTDVEYVMAAAEDALSRAHYAGDALPVHNPWLGPDQVAAWLGAELLLRPRENTSWARPFVKDWAEHPRLAIDPANRWWRLYLEILRASVEFGMDKWVTAYPDLHTGIDGLSAIRGPENLLLDLLGNPEPVRRAMRDMTALFKSVVDTVSPILRSTEQGASNWTMGWSRDRFVCVGQNDFSCMISPELFESFCFQDTRETCDHVDHSIYHLDGPGAIRHLPRILEIESLDCVQWIQGAGRPPPSRWLDLLKRIQESGKSVQVYYGPDHGDEADLREELDILCRDLDADRLFFWAVASSVEEADALVRRAREGRG
jgi:hypothetical protein